MIAEHHWTARVCKSDWLIVTDGPQLNTHFVYFLLLSAGWLETVVCASYAVCCTTVNVSSWYETMFWIECASSGSSSKNLIPFSSLNDNLHNVSRQAIHCMDAVMQIWWHSRLPESFAWLQRTFSFSYLSQSILFRNNVELFSSYSEAHSKCVVAGMRIGKSAQCLEF